VTVQHEHRQDQIFRSQSVLAHQSPGGGVAAQAAGSVGREGRKGSVHGLALLC
jgi:hypothetical protein